MAVELLLPGLGSTTPAGGVTVAVLTGRSRLAARSGGRGTGHRTRNPRQEPRHEQRHRDGSPCPGRSHPQRQARRRLPRPGQTPRGRGAGNRLAGRRSEAHTSELQSLMRISYAVFCLKKKKKIEHNQSTTTKKNN